MFKDIVLLWGSYFAALVIGGYIVGKFMFKVLTSSKAGAEEKILQKMGIDAVSPMNWREYSASILCFSVLGIVLLQAILMAQHLLPLNGDKLPGLSFWMAFNIAVSFVTNTNWQNYAGESTMGHFSQMVGLTLQNYLSAAAGMGVMLALVRGLVNKESRNLGNFWRDISRSTFRILLPLSILFAMFLMSQGVPQTKEHSLTVKTLEGQEQKIPVGPVASQVAIKMVGTNGGGFYNANGAHPFENPTPLANFVSLIFILLLPVACMFLVIEMLPNRNEGRMIFSVMTILLTAGMIVSLWASLKTNPVTTSSFIEGKDTRISTAECSLWSVTTTAVSNGSINCAHSSLAPMAQAVALFNMMTGEIIFGGAGAGVYGMFLYVLLTVFLAGLMVGRTPEYLGKKIGAREIAWVGFALLAPGLLNLTFSALALIHPLGLASLAHKGPHGLSEAVYAFSSTFGNNGSAFGGFNGNTTFFNILGGFAMLFGRFAVIVPVLFVADSLGQKKIAPAGVGTLKTDTALFAFLLLSVVIVVGALTFFPVLALGPIAEHMIMIHSN